MCWEGAWIKCSVPSVLNEPEGFDQITGFYPTVPMYGICLTFITRIEADKTYPTLLANG